MRQISGFEVPNRRVISMPKWNLHSLLFTSETKHIPYISIVATASPFGSKLRPAIRLSKRSK